MTALPQETFGSRYVSLLWAPPEQADQFAALHARLFPEPWNEAAFTTMLGHPGSVAMMVLGGDPRRMGAFVLAQVTADEAEILTLAVDPQWQRRGIGGRLVDEVKRAAKRAGAKNLFLEVALFNDAARALYTKCGFVETGRRNGYYATPSGREDALLMHCSLL